MLRPVLQNATGSKVILRRHFCNNQYLCLQPDCLATSRLLCDKCLRETLHHNHQIILVNKFVDPFSRLSMNSYAQDSRQIYQMLNVSIRSVSKSIQKFEHHFTQEIDRMKRTLFDTMKAISGTYSKELIEDALRLCERRPTGDKEEDRNAINLIAERIRNLFKLQPENFQGETAKFSLASKEAVDIISRDSEDVLRIVRDIGQKFTQIKNNLLDQHRTVHPLGRSLVGREEEAVQNVCLENLKNRTETAKKIELEPLNMKNSITFEQDDKVVELKDSVSPEFSSASSNFVISSIKKGRKKQAVPPLPRKNRKRQIKMEYEGKVRNAEPTEQIFIEKSDWATLTINQAGESIEEEIQDYSQFKRLVIERIDNKETVSRILPKMTNLYEVVIYDAAVGEEGKIEEFMRALPMSIREIYFNCSNEFTLESINILNSRGLNSITHLEYFFDVIRDLRRVDESLYFKKKDMGVRIEPLKFDEALNIVTVFPKIRNIWIPIKGFKSVSGKKIQFPALESLVLGQLEEQMGSRCQLPKRLMTSLLHTKNLKSLSLLNAQVHDTIFIEVLKNNPFLEALYMECCHFISEESMSIISPESNLTNFLIKDCPRVTGKFIEQLEKVKVFIMDYAEPYDTEDVVVTFESFEKLSSLAYLNLYGNCHFNNKLLYDLKSSEQTLKSLNIGFTSITEDCPPAFEKLQNLESLCLDDNKIKVETMFSIFHFTNQIQKLSLCGYNGEGSKAQMTTEDLNTIGQLLPKLSHLSIKYCSKFEGRLDMDQFKNLKSVEIQKNKSEELAQALREAGVEVIEGED